MFSTPSQEVEIRLTVSLPPEQHELGGFGGGVLKLSFHAYLGKLLMLLSMICLREKILLSTLRISDEGFIVGK